MKSKMPSPFSSDKPKNLTVSQQNLHFVPLSYAISYLSMHGKGQKEEQSQNKLCQLTFTFVRQLAI